MNLGAFLGISILSIPALKLNHLKRKASAARKSEAEADGPLRFVRGKIAERWAQYAADWSAFDQACLFLGYGLLLGSSLLRLVWTFP